MKEGYRGSAWLLGRWKTGAMNQGIRGPLEAGKGRETDSPLEPPERKRAPLTPGFQWDPGWTSHPQVCKITMNLCCLNY